MKQNASKCEEAIRDDEPHPRLERRAVDADEPSAHGLVDERPRVGKEPIDRDSIKYLNTPVLGSH
jgi:hypothetical protein